MTNLERHQHCICGKVSFDKRTAQTKRNSLERMGRDRMRIYQCPESDTWHLTKYNPFANEPNKKPWAKPFRKK